MSDNGQSNESSKSLVERLAERQSSDDSKRERPNTDERRTTNVPVGGIQPGQEPVTARPSTAKTRHIATIDLKRLRSNGFVTPDGGRSQVVEEFRAIKRPLLKRAFDGDSQGRSHLIMVTSARPGEGKSFCSINLAMSIASERGLNVLLVDGDVIKSDLPEVLGFRSEAGLIDLLVDRDLDISDVMVRTNIPNFSVLPAGTTHDHATELMAGPAMADLISDLASRYSDRVIIFNAPPVLVSSEAGVLASWVGQIVMIVEANQTGKADIGHAVDILGEGRNINFVLNKVTDRRVSERYGAYSYYGRRHQS